MRKKIINVMIFPIAVLAFGALFFNYGIINFNIKATQGDMKSGLRAIHRIQNERLKLQGKYECDLDILKPAIDEVHIYS